MNRNYSIHTDTLLTILFLLSSLLYMFEFNIFTDQYHSIYICPIIAVLLFTINILFAGLKECKHILRVTLLASVLWSTIEIICSLIINMGVYPIIGTLGNPSILAMIVTLHTPALLYLYSKGNKVIKLITTTLFIFFFIAVLMTQSRTGLICMLICTLYVYKEKIHFRTKFFVGTCIAISIILISLLFAKTDSTAGRYFILKRSIEMVQEKPFGWGYNGFSSNYMNFQAKYFENNKNEENGLLADNIRHPLNEYIYLTINYGIHTTLVLLLTVGYLIYYKSREKSDESQIFILTFILLAVWMMFSYPLSQPFIWSILYILFLLFICNQHLSIKKGLKGTLIISALVIVTVICQKYFYRHQWEYAVKICKAKGYQSKSLVILENIKGEYINDADFLYSYATVLYNNQQYNKAIDIAKRCDSISSNYELEILLGNCYMFIGNLELSKKHYINASNMCPNRFIPLYKLFKIYKALNNKEQMCNVGEIILNKKIKVPSRKIDIILNNVTYEINKIKNL